MPTKKILNFLNELKENNNREWFAQNKDRYEIVKSEFEEIAKLLIINISEFDEDIKNIDVKDCVFRIYRDTRFSLDKTPYKTHFGVFIASAGGRKSQRGGYYLHFDPAGCFLAVGVWCPPPNILKALRKCIYENIEEFNEIRNEQNFKKYFSSFYEEDKLKKVPTGFPKDFPDAELLKLKHYMVDYKLDNELMDAPDLVSKLTQIAKAAYLFNKFLNYTVDDVI